MKNLREDIYFRVMSKVTTVKSSVDFEEGCRKQCWIWTGPTSGSKTQTRGNGYGRISYGGKTMAVHRIIYTHFYGIIPHGKHIDHLCKNRLCCNPNHLECVTIKQNQRRKKKVHRMFPTPNPDTY